MKLNLKGNFAMIYEQIFDILDINGMGKITYEEFMAIFNEYN